MPPPKTYQHFNSFNAGELSELLYNREDITKYKSGCRVLENALPLVEGGAKKMPGTYFAGTTIGGNTHSRLVPFQFSTSQGAILELSAGVIRVWEPNPVGSWTLGLASAPLSPVSKEPTVITQDSAGNLAWTIPSPPYFADYPTIGPAEDYIANGLTMKGYGFAATQPTVSITWSMTYNLLNTPSESNNTFIQVDLVDATGHSYDTYSARPGVGGNYPTRTVNVSLPTSIVNDPGFGLLVHVGNNILSLSEFQILDAKITIAFALTPIALLTPYTDADLFDLDCSTQSADVLWIFHPSYPPACVERLGPSTWQYSLAPPGGLPGEPAYRGTGGLISPGISGLGTPILQITQAYSALVETYDPFSVGDRIYINNCSGMTELNQGEFFIASSVGAGQVTSFTGHIDGGISTQAGNILTITAVASGTIYIGMSVSGANVLPETVINEFFSGSGGTGTYGVTQTQLVQSGTVMTGIGGNAYTIVTAVPIGAVFTGSVSGTVLTVTAVAAGALTPGQGMYFPGVLAGTAIASFGTGTGGTGTYNLNISQSAGSQAMSTVPVQSITFSTYQGGGFAVKVVPMFASTDNYPACGTFYQSRLCVAGTINKPTTIYGSVIDDYPDFISDPNRDDYALEFTLVSNQVDEILNAIATPNALLLGTAGGIWTVSGNTGIAISPSNVNAQKQTSWGVGRLQPQLVGDSTIFVSRSARIVIFIVFDFASNQWQNFDLTRLNRNITIGPTQTTSGVVQTAFQAEPYPIFWSVRADGQLLGLVFNKQDQVFAWFRINMPNGIIESVAVISGQNQEDMIAVVVNRTINGATVRYVEYFMPQELFGQLSNAFFVNAGLTLSLSGPFAITGINNGSPCVVQAPGHNFVNGQMVQITGVNGMTQINQDKSEAYTVANSNPSAGTFQLAGMDTTAFGVYAGGGAVMQVTNVVTGMNYLLGQSVVAVGDNVVIAPSPGIPVTSNTLTFPYYCNRITVGLPYTITVQPTNPIFNTPSLTTRGIKQKLSKVVISLYQSMGGQFGTDPSHMYDIVYDPGSSGQQPAMSTQENKRDLDADWDDQSTFYITQSDPLPFTLRGLVMDMSFNAD